MIAANNKKKVAAYRLAMPASHPSSSPNKDSERDSNHRRRKGAWLSLTNCNCLSLFFGGVGLAVLFLISIGIPLAVILTRSVGEISSTTTTTGSTATVLTSSSNTMITTTASTITATTTTASSTITITSNICTSTITGIQMIANCFPCFSFPFYYTFAYTYTAISNVTRIGCAFRKQNYYFALDDVSVRDFTAPTIELISNGGFETGNLTSWLYCNPNNRSLTGGVKSNLTYNSFTYYPHSGTYYYLGGSNASADYIIQSFSTQIGHQYSVTLALILPVGGNLTSADLFLGV